jgi:hypothetical protein
MPKHFPSAVSVYNMLGESYAKLDNLAAAEFYISKALDLNDNHLPALLTMMHLRVKQVGLNE